jgi:hypothetical protein
MHINRPVLNSVNTHRLTRILLIAGITLLLAGCARHYTVATNSDPYGFFSGLWHGIVFPFSLLTNLLSWLLGNPPVFRSRQK